MAAPAPRGLKPFYVILAVVAAVGLGALFLQSRRPPISIPANVKVTEADTAGFQGYRLGNADAPVEVTVYADYQCPACGSFDAVQFPSVRERLIESGRVRWRYRDFPLDIHPQTRIAAHAAACANDQGKYWEMHRFIYESQNDWSFKKSAADQFRSIAKSLGLDLGKYDECMQSARYAGRIQASYNEAIKVGVGSTPTFLIGGRLFPGDLPYDALKKIVDSIAPPAAAPAPAH